MQTILLVLAFLASLTWATTYPADGQQFSAEDQQRIVIKLQEELVLLEQRRAELDHDIGQRQEQLNLLRAVLNTNAVLNQRVRALQPTPIPDAIIMPKPQEEGSGGMP